MKNVIVVLIFILFAVIFLFIIFPSYLPDNVIGHIIQFFTALGVLGILFTWWQWKNKEHENLVKNLSSISITGIEADGTAEIKNTSIIDGSDLFVEVYKPHNFENPYGNEEFMKYVANSEENYKDKKRKIINFDSINWNPEASLSVRLSIGEVAKFHLKDIQKEKLFVHFAPIKIEIRSSPAKIPEKIRFMLFQFSSSELRRSEYGDFIKNSLHPYDKWLLTTSS
jgi:hypothetical protein